ncbi:hypothetical protein L9F63_007884, partial [Diploptera punctata]
NDIHSVYRSFTYFFYMIFFKTAYSLMSLLGMFAIIKLSSVYLWRFFSPAVLMLYLQTELCICNVHIDGSSIFLSIQYFLYRLFIIIIFIIITIIVIIIYYPKFINPISSKTHFFESTRRKHHLEELATEGA